MAFEFSRQILEKYFLLINILYVRYICVYVCMCVYVCIYTIWRNRGLPLDDI
jgi:hypothetical protein